MKKYKFTLGVEKLIDPISVGTLHFLQSFNDKLPTNIQNKLVNNSSKKYPLMGFVVEPYSYYLCYKIKDKEKMKSLLPDNFELTKTKIFEDDIEDYYFIIGAFSARTSAFFGSRIECYLIAKDLSTGLLSWVIVDYDTNTISYNKKDGLVSPSVDKGIVTTNYDGTVIVNMKNNNKEKEISFSSNIKNGQLKNLDQKLWVEGNLSIAYGKKLSKTSEVFSLKFDPKEMKEALQIKNEDLNIEVNNWYSQYLESSPSNIACFQYAQHFLSDSPGHYTKIKNEKELTNIIKDIDFNNVQVYSTESFKKLIFLIPMLLTLIIVILVIYIVIKI